MKGCEGRGDESLGESGSGTQDGSDFSERFARHSTP